MNPRISFPVLALLSVLYSVPAQAWLGFHLESTAFPGFASSNTGSIAGSPTYLGGTFSGNALNAESGFSYDLRNTGGFMLGEHFLVGFTYNYAKTPKSRAASADNDSLDQVYKKYEYGPAAGLFVGNFRLVFSYFFWGTETFTDRRSLLDGTPLSDISLTNHLRNGYQFVLGYNFNVTTNIKIGPSLAYRHVNYKTQDASNGLDPTNPAINYSGRAFTTDASESNLTPMISLMLHF